MERLLDSIKAVRHSLGGGYTEAVFHRAVEVELRLQGIPYESEVVVTVTYKGHTVGTVRLDLIVDKRIVVELKAVKPGKVLECHVEQARKYMDLLGLQEGLVVNFAGPDETKSCGATSADKGLDYRLVSRQAVANDVTS